MSVIKDELEKIFLHKLKEVWKKKSKCVKISIITIVCIIFVIVFVPLLFSKVKLYCNKWQTGIESIFNCKKDFIPKDTIHQSDTIHKKENIEKEQPKEHVSSIKGTKIEKDIQKPTNNFNFEGTVFNNSQVNINQKGDIINPQINTHNENKDGISK